MKQLSSINDLYTGLYNFRAMLVRPGEGALVF